MPSPTERTKADNRDFLCAQEKEVLKIKMKKEKATLLKVTKKEGEVK